MNSVTEQMLQFLRVLRQNDFTVSVAETQDALRAAEIVGLAHPGQLAAALKATVAKSPEEAATFDTLFELFYSGGVSGRGEDDRETSGAGDESDSSSNAAGGLDLPGLAASVAQGNTAHMEMAIRQAGEDVGVEDLRNFWQEGFFSYRILEKLDESGVREALRAAIQQAREQGDEATATVLEQRLARFEAQVRDYVNRQLQQHDLHTMAKFRRRQLKEQSFYRASQEDLRLIRREVDRLARKLKARIALRRRRYRRGQLHLQETIRANLQTGLMPYHLKYRRKKKSKPELVIWFDLSESVRAVSEFTLMFVYSLQDLFHKVRSFGFVADTVELTELFRARQFDASFTEVMSAKTINVYRHSDYGEALRQLWTKYGDAVRPQTVLIVLGDARSNYQHHEPELMQRIARRARHALWLNPEPKNSWGLGDSVMPDYQPYFHSTATVANLKQLEIVVEKLVEKLW